jgi:ligand-binding SRPBCC domain-containing protein
MRDGRRRRASHARDAAVIRVRGGDHTLTAQTFVPRPLEAVFAFFSAAENLQRITPPTLSFEILTPRPIHMGPGTVIDYRLRLFGVPFGWLTRISRWEPPTFFVDEQLSGPYETWVHAHTLRAVPGGTMVDDVVHYRLPMYPLGELFLPLVRRQLKSIFAFRARRIREILGEPVRPA